MDKASDDISDKEVDADIEDGALDQKSAEVSEGSPRSTDGNASTALAENGKDSDEQVPDPEPRPAETEALKSEEENRQGPASAQASAAVEPTPAAAPTAAAISAAAAAEVGSSTSRSKDPEERQFEENVKYLYRSHQREPGKRRVKPNLQLLEMDLNLPEEDSEDDSDYKVDGDEDQGDDDEEDDDDDATDDDDEAAAATNEDGKAKDACANGGDPSDRKKSESEGMNGLLSAVEKAKQLSEGGLTNGVLKVNVCNICLGDMSGETDEIVECDNCGVTVHEGCYGVSDGDSVLSTGSSSSTEPWFCDSCKAGVEKPKCELCPNMGGIFKETDAGRWVHLVCALYTPGCAFGSTEKLTPVTLFEMQYSKWGAKPCHLCEDPLMARTGVTINCDAGMCRISFHVTCAQRQGLLSDANPEYIADPFYAHCKVHVDKMKMRTKKRNWALIQYQVRMKREKEQREELEGQQPPKEKERILRKLNWLRERYAIKKENNTKVWLPTQKMPRFMPSSATAIEKYRKKAELYGLTHLLVAPPEDRRWHTQVSFSVDFVSYFLDRQRRIKESEKTLEKMIEESTMLRRQQALMSELYEKVSGVCKAERAHNRHMIEVLNKLWAPLRLLGIKFEPQMLRDHAERQGFTSPQKMLKSCKVCSSVEEQHQQIECEQCHATFHLFCLNPPLTRFPKKTKGINWLCEDCLEANKTAHERKKALPSARRSRQQSSRMARATSEESVSRPPRGKAKKKPARKSAAKAKEKTSKEEAKEATDPETEDDATAAVAPTDTATASSENAETETVDESPTEKEKSPAEKAPRTSKGRKRRKTPVKVGGSASKKRKSTTQTASEDAESAAVDSTDTKEQIETESEQADDLKTQKQLTDEPEDMDVPVSKDEETKAEIKKKETEVHTKSDKKDCNAESSGKKHCVKCESSDTNQIVVCDECNRGIHWSCLEPPVKKNPKPRGYTWTCEECENKDSKTEPSPSKTESPVRKDDSKDEHTG
ncbi:PHD finger protein 14 [Galendromus occidentalis]|uniref:PHD finger protein 14 n=1 Tax=Galendromus occidentalis TaxID=34638 RepID=A0AAJ7P9R0_9ACAR|nr:PHD finger protein 14 [Galendromus occidentalis]